VQNLDCAMDAIDFTDGLIKQQQFQDFALLRQGEYP
jgi:hypothetical protein